MIKTENTLIQLVDVDAERVRYLYRNAPVAIAVNIAIGGLMYWVLWDRVLHDYLTDWLLALIVITAIRAFTVFQFIHTSPPNQSMANWRMAFLIGSTLNGLLWGMTLWIFAPFASFETPVFITFAVGGLSAGAAALLGGTFRVYLSYVIATMVPVAAWFLMQEGSEIHFIMGSMLVIYIFAVLSAGMIYRRVLLKSIDLSNQLVEAREEAEIANKAKSKFLASMSHELRTPLNAILGFGQLLELDQEQLHEKHRTHVQEILKGGHHLLELINEVLDLSKIEAGRIGLSIETVHLDLLIDECRTLIEPSLSKYKVSLHYKDSECQPPTVLADFTRLKQVLLNLLSNACKYNHTGGRVTLGCTPVADNRVRISVEDTGAGIPMNNQSKLFHPFSRLGQEASTIEGTGIGLVISKQLIELMDGEIGYSSNPGEGSTFWIELPCSVVQP